MTRLWTSTPYNAATLKSNVARKRSSTVDWQLGDKNPIISIHDVGAGGLSNAFPELVNDAGRGAVFKLREVPLEEHGLNPLQIWCNESQERYVLSILEKIWRPSAPSANANAARLPWSARRPTTVI